MRLSPTSAGAVIAPGAVWIDKGEYEWAVQEFEEGLRRQPTNPGVLNAVAWKLATHRDVKIRNGKRAVELATRACEATEWKDGAMTDTLAAAYAETGDFEQARQWQEKALKAPGVAPGDQDGMRRRLQLYRERKAYHEK